MKLNINRPNHKISVFSSLKTLFVKEDYFDLIFVCKRNLVVKTHKMVLTSVSDYLKKIILSCTDDITYISLPDINHKVIRLLLVCLYEGGVKVNKKDLEEMKNVMTLLGINLPNSVVSPINLSNNNKPVISSQSHKVKQEIQNSNLADWMNIEHSSGVDSLDHLSAPSFYSSQVAKYVSGLDDLDNLSLAPQPATLATTETNSLSVQDSGVQLHSELNFQYDGINNIALKEEKMDEAEVFSEDLFPSVEIDTSDMNLGELDVVLPFSLSDQLEQCEDNDKKGQFCLDCGKPYRCEDSMDTEICMCDQKLWSVPCRTDNTNKPHTCNLCGRGFFHKGNLRQHITKGCKLTLLHGCDFCGFRAQNEEKLLDHMVVHSGNRPFRCDKCGRCFINEISFRKHRIFHSIENSYECQTCGRCFCQKSAYYKHLPLHGDTTDVSNDVKQILVAIGLHQETVKN